MRGVGLVDGFHHLVGNGREGFFAAAVFINDTGCRGGIGVDDVVAVLGRIADGFRQVVIEDQAGTGNVGQIGGDVAFGDFDLAVLHILGMHELDFVDHLQFVEQNSADQTIEITAGNQTVFFLTHGDSLFLGNGWG